MSSERLFIRGRSESYGSSGSLREDGGMSSNLRTPVNAPADYESKLTWEGDFTSVNCQIGRLWVHSPKQSEISL